VSARPDGTRVEDAGDGHALFVERDPTRMPLAALLPWAGAALARHRSRALAAHGISPTALGVLGALDGHGGLSHRELAGLLGVTPATLTPVVDGLERDGDLLRERDPTDRRVVRLALTASGAARWSALSGRVAAELAGLLPALPEPQEALVRGYLTAVLSAVGGR